MKKSLLIRKSLFYLLFALIFVGCNNDEINDLNDKYNKLLQEQVQQAKAIKNHEAILKALENKLVVNSIEKTDNGYKILFSDNTSVEIANGHTPIFSLGDNGNWFIDGKDSNIKAEGSTPEIKDGYWYINGESTGVKAQPQDGINAPTITNIVIQDGGLTFTFSDSSTLKVPMEDNSSDYNNSKGFFIINEGWFGHEKGSINFYNNRTNKVEPKIFAKNNPGKELGVTTQFATIYNEQLYLVSKQGDFVTADPKTLKEIARIKDFNKVASDGRAFCGVNAKLGLVSTSNGIFKLNLNPLSVGEKIEGFSGEVRELLQYKNHVYALSKDRIDVINTTTWKIEKTFNKGKSGLVVSKDGSIWSTNENELLKINPYRLEMETIVLPSNIKASYNKWAWTKSPLTASKQENALFFISDKNIYKYVIGSIESLNSPLCKIPSGMIYGAGMSVDPNTNQVVVTTIGGWGDLAANNNLYFFDGTTGSLKKELVYEGYFFPAMILFPEN